MKNIFTKLIPLAALLFISAPSFAEEASPAPEGMAFVKGGCFQMGNVFGGGFTSEKPAHEVCVNDFFMDKYLVTQTVYKAKTGANPANFKTCPECPVENVTWHDAAKFCADQGKRLPTEAEWEYAARSGGKKEKYPGTDDERFAAQYAWSYQIAATTQPVGGRKPNGLGLYDMDGNVWQWVNDRFEKHYYDHSPKDNPKGPDEGENRTRRGGAYTNNVEDVRTTIRSEFPPDRGTSNLGFRCAK